MAGNVLIVGGGIGGLSAGLALHLKGVPVTVIERMDDTVSAGGALQVWANGMQALARLGLADAIKDRANAVEAWSFRSWRRGELLRVPIGDFAREYRVERPQMVRRSDLIQVLSDALGRERIEFGSVYTSFSQDRDGVVLELADGRRLHGSVLVGADGIDSKVRAAIAPAAAPRHVGYRYVRALIEDAGPDPHERDPGVFRFTFGRGDRFGVYPRGRSWLYWFAVVVTKPGNGASTDSKAALLRRFGSFPAPIAELVRNTPDELIVGQDIRDLESLDSWSDRRVVLLGDAAHAMTPNLGRGASESIEDAEDLAEELAAVDLEDGDAVGGALRRFEQRRRSETASVQRRSHAIGVISSWQYPLSSPVRDAVMRFIVSRKMPKQIREELASLGSR